MIYQTWIVKNTGGLPETVTHQKSGIIHPLFSLFLSSHGILVSLQPHSPLTQRVLPEIFMLFSWFKSIWLHELLGRNHLLPSIFHSLPCFMPSHFRVPGSTGFILLQQLKNSVFFPPILNINSHLVSVFFAREASGLSRTQCLRKGSPGAAYIRASLWLWASWPQSPQRGRRKGAVGVIRSKQGWGQERKYRRSPVENSIGIPSILAGLMSYIWIRFLGICFKWHPTKTYTFAFCLFVLVYKFYTYEDV